MKSKGYSLVEMLVVIGIAAAATGLSVPFLIQYAENSRFESEAQKTVSHIRRTKMLAVSSGESYSVCVPLGEPNLGNSWHFYTIKNSGGNCGGNAKKIIESTTSHRVFQKSGKTEIKKISFHPRGTSTNKSFCIQNKKDSKRIKITVSNFARISVISGDTNLCN